MPQSYRQWIAVRKFIKLTLCLQFTFLFSSIASAADEVPDVGSFPKDSASVIGFCSSCHGVNGLSHLADIPNLFGQSEAYLTEQIKDFRDQKRRSEFMDAFITQISDEQIKAVAQYYAALPSKNEIKTQWRGDKWPGDMELGERIAYVGKMDEDLPACTTCHGPNGIGVKPYLPRLAGQNPRYIENQLLAWKNDTRPAGRMAMMGPIAKALSDDEIKAVSIYFSQQGSTQAEIKKEEEAIKTQIDNDVSQALKENAATPAGEQ